MSTVLTIVSLLLYLFFIALLGRLVFDWVQVLARDWRPRGAILMLAERVYTVTDPPLKFLRRFIPPLRLGRVRLDPAFLVLVLTVSLLLDILR